MLRTTEIDRKRIGLRNKGVRLQCIYDLQTEHVCAACEKAIWPGTHVYHNEGHTTFMHYYATDCVIDHGLTPQQRGYLAQITGGKRRVERVEQRFKAPGEFGHNGKRPVTVPSWVDGICTVTPDGQVMLPDQQPVALLPAPRPIQVEVEIVPDTRPFLTVINEQWQQNHGLVVPVTFTPAKFHVTARPLHPGSDMIFYDVRDSRDKIIQSSPRLDIAQRVADYHNAHVT